ncbi:hypothetical protein OG921_10540 [Aldersonia sp. NBC_00410]|uniref:hypothetical protein n=1 Tax=Aldersonia sp. NBC_00410 TaxID=2975954 RepID=UPI0022500507|nr:hypothetical protein [Aldersonia sp. NBC_00410]MCX5043602.1 hypothetical protein [Aldersonia sp. NBC_00410]
MDEVVLTLRAVGDHAPAKSGDGLGVGGVGAGLGPAGGASQLLRRGVPPGSVARQPLWGGYPTGHDFHSLQHTYASLCIAAGIQPFVLSKFMGHANTNVTLGVYAHLFEDDHTDAMTALGAMAPWPPQVENVVALWRG